MSDNKIPEEKLEQTEERILTADEMIAMIEGRPLNTDGEPKKRNPWGLVNFFVVFSFFLGACWLLTTIPLTMPLFFAIIALHFILIPLNFLRDKWEIFKKPLLVARVICFTCLGLMFLSPLMVLGFSRIEPLYNAKKFAYCGTTQYYALPDELPEVCRDYTFITQGQIPAQDYHGSSYLAFYTDEKTIDEYEELFQSRSYKLKTFDLTYQERKNEVLEEYAENGFSDGDPQIEDLVMRSFGVPAHAWSRFSKQYTGAVSSPTLLVREGSSVDRGVLLDRETGLVLFWT